MVQSNLLGFKAETIYLCACICCFVIISFDIWKKLAVIKRYDIMFLYLYSLSACNRMGTFVKSCSCCNKVLCTARQISTVYTITSNKSLSRRNTAYGARVITQMQFAFQIAKWNFLKYSKNSKIAALYSYSRVEPA